MDLQVAALGHELASWQAREVRPDTEESPAVGGPSDARPADTNSHLSMAGKPEHPSNWRGLPGLCDALTGRLEKLHRPRHHPDA